MLETMQFKQDEALFWSAERFIVEQQSREKENLEQIVEADLDHAHLAFVLQLIALTDTICKIYSSRFTLYSRCYNSSTLCNYF